MANVINYIEKVLESLGTKKRKITERKNNIIKAKSEREFQMKLCEETETSLKELGLTDFSEEGIADFVKQLDEKSEKLIQSISKKFEELNNI